MAAIDFGTGPDTATGDTVSQAAAKLQARLDAMGQGSVSLPTLALSAAQSHAEGNSGTTTFQWTLTLNRNGSTAMIPYSWSVSGVTADAADFGGTFPSGSGSFGPSETTKTITVLVMGDSAVEPDESFTLSAVGNIPLAAVTSSGTIVNDDIAQGGGGNTVLVSSLSGLYGDADVNATTQGGSWHDDTAVLQTWINSTAARTSTLVFDRACMITGLNLPSNTTIVLNANCGVFQKNGSNRSAFRNLNRVRVEAQRQATSAEKATYDHDISITGAGTINGNQDNQSYNEEQAATGNGYVGTIVGPVQMFGVINANVDCFVTYPKTYAIWASNVYNSRFINRGMKILLDGAGKWYQQNQDGVHINGPADTLYLENNGQSGDDFIALNADDLNGFVQQTNGYGPYVGNGPITNVTMKARPNKASLGVRLLSYGMLIDNITIDYAGTTIARALELSNPFYPSAQANIGNVHLTNFSAQYERFDLNRYDDSQTHSLIRLQNANIKNLTFDTVMWSSGDNTNTTSRLIDIEDGCEGFMQIGDLEMSDTSGWTFAPTDGVPDMIRRRNSAMGIQLDKVRWNHVSSPSVHLIHATAGSGGIKVANTIVDKLTNIARIDTGAIVDYWRDDNVAMTNTGGTTAAGYGVLNLASGVQNIYEGHSVGSTPSPVAVGAGAAALVLSTDTWSPALLFANGEQGGWYDPSDLSSMWQDSAKTTAAVVDSPVGAINDKSGRGNHATQATASKRPILRSSNGLYWLEFDGVDDALATPSFSLNATTGVGLGMYAGRYTGTGTEIVAETGSNFGLSSAVVMYVNDTTGKSSAGRANGVNASATTFTHTVNVDHVVTANWTTDGTYGYSLPRVDGVSGANQTVTGQYGAPSAFTNNPLNIGARAGTSLFFSGRLNGMVLTGRNATKYQTKKMEKFLADKTGVTLQG